MLLTDLLQGLTSDAVPALHVAGLSCHSKQVRAGDVFVALAGPTTDGHAFIREAVARGASAVIAQRWPEGMTPDGPGVSAWQHCPCVVVPDTRAALVTMATRFYGHPSRKLRLVGVTGTNGKTTTTYLLRAILEQAGCQAGLLGTIAYQIGGRVVPSTNTTPGVLELQRYFAQMVGQGVAWCAMEVSSHALAQGRVAGLEFEAAVFTNLGSDHLDYHKTREDYAAAKRRLFGYLRPEGHAIINMDDPFGRDLAATLRHPSIVGYGLDPSAKVTLRHIMCTWEETSLVIDSPWGTVPVTTPLVGRHNIPNISAATASLLALGIKPSAIREGLAHLAQVPGRMEQVANDMGVHILIDYAHTADALRLILLSLRELTRGRVIVIFGCGGNRDQTKRPVMGKMASLLADHVMLTSDNPRGEEPLDIIHQIKRGFPEGFTHFDVIPDREQAIVAALASARREDTILIAGKGHEAYQLFGHVSVPFSDRDVVERWLTAHQTVAFS